MPWNLPLWWQLRRLRCAVEMDCDARVLRRGYDVSHYGETLIAVGERQSARIALSAAMAEPRSLLERRLRNMLWKPKPYARAAAVMLACIGTVFAVGAAGISPPDDAGGGNPTSLPNAVDTATLDGRVGFYQLNDHAVFTITRDGQQLNAQLTGQPLVPIFARSNVEFSYKDKSISFVIGPDGLTTSLILHQYGVDIPMNRIDGATAQRIASIRAERRYRPQPERYGALIILR
jgi:hypothetical protein